MTIQIITVNIDRHVIFTSHHLTMTPLNSMNCQFFKEAFLYSK